MTARLLLLLPALAIAMPATAATTARVAQRTGPAVKCPPPPPMLAERRCPRLPAMLAADPAGRAH